MYRAWILILLGILITCAAVPGTARAETESAARQRSSELKRIGDQAMDDIRYADAIEAYSKAYSAHPDPALLYNRGRAHQARGELVEALRDLRRFRDTAAPATRDRVPGLDDLIAEVESKVGALVVHCSVEGASLSVEGRSVGTTPLAEPVQVTAGVITIEVTAEGRRPFHMEVDVPGGTEVPVEVTLQPLETSAVLVVQSDVDAEVFVDGKRAGAAPAEVRVAPGRHRVVTRARAHHDAEATIVVDAGHRRIVQLTPEARPPVVARWWFWTGIGVVTAATVTTLVLTVEKPHDSGENFSPGAIVGPLTVQF